MRKEQDTIDWSLIRRKVEGNLTASEHEELEAWLEQDIERKKFVERAQRYYKQEYIPLPDLEQTDRAWEGVVIMCRLSSRRAFFRKLRLWSAAASVLLALAGIGLWNYSGVREESLQIAQEVIEPGSRKGCLILSDGTVMNLGETTSVKQLSDNLVNIRLAQTEIVYESQENPEQEVYNTFRTPRGGEYNLLLSDGTRVWLNARSELTYPVAFGKRQRKVRLKGEAYFEVAKDTVKPFFVETGELQIKVLGTAFNITAYEDEVAVTTTLVTGGVQLLSEIGDLNILQPSQQAIYSKDVKQTEIRQVKTDIYTQWREGRFVFRDEPLGNIMRILSRWYDVEYEFSRPELAKCRFYGVIGRYENIYELLNQFEKTEKVHFFYEGKKVIVKK